MHRDIVFHKDVRKGINVGVRKVVEAIKCTFGPNSGIVGYETAHGIKFTKDGVTVAKNVLLLDKVERVGAELIKDICLRNEENSGDGTSTAGIMGEAQLHDEPVSKEYQKTFDELNEESVKIIKTMTKPVESAQDIYNIAMIASNGDKKLAKDLSEVYKRGGADAQLLVHKIFGLEQETKIKFTEGFSWNKGFIDEIFCNDQGRVSYEGGIKYFITDAIISRAEDMKIIFDQAFPADGSGGPIVIVADAVVDQAMAFVRGLRQQQKLPIAVIRAPEQFDLMSQVLGDMAASTGGTFYSKEGFKLTEEKTETEKQLVKKGKKGQPDEYKDVEVVKQIPIEINFGSSHSFVSTRTKTVIIKPDGDITERLALIETDLNDPILKGPIREVLKKRKSRLMADLADLFVGAKTQKEFDEIKDRVEDAVKATQSSHELGMLPGAGTSYVRVAHKLVEKYHDKFNDEQRKALTKYVESYFAPMFLLYKSATGELPSDEFTQKIVDNPNSTFDATNGEFIEDAYKAGIVDSAKVNVEVVQNSHSIFKLGTNTQCILAIADGVEVNDIIK